MHTLLVFMPQDNKCVSHFLRSIQRDRNPNEMICVQVILHVIEIYIAAGRVSGLIGFDTKKALLETQREYQKQNLETRQ